MLPFVLKFAVKLIVRHEWKRSDNDGLVWFIHDREMRVKTTTTITVDIYCLWIYTVNRVTGYKFVRVTGY